MRRLMVTIAVVLGVAVIDVEAQHHETDAAKPAAKTEPAKAEPAKAEEKAKAPSVNELAENISHVAVVIDSRRGRVMPVRERLGLDTKDAKEATKATKAAPQSAPAATPPAPRVELNWRAPLLVWPEELLGLPAAE